MDFRIPGPLEVWNDARRVPVKGRLHPRLLAGLLLNNGRTVSLNWLVDLLWDDEPPAPRGGRRRTWWRHCGDNSAPNSDI